MARDKISKEKRSHIMSCIRSKNTKLELLLRKVLRSRGLRFRTYAKLPGSPDIVFNKQKLAVFVDGDFWHGYQWKKLKPKLKNDFWIKKISRNIERDKEVNTALNDMGWKVVRIWEHKLRKDIETCVNQIERVLVKNES